MCPWKRLSTQFNIKAWSSGEGVGSLRERLYHRVRGVAAEKRGTPDNVPLFFL
jgi:hypothetical protein